MNTKAAVSKIQSKKEITTKSKLRENVEAIVIAIVLALFIRTFVVQAFKIPSGSMKPTLQIGDHILVNKFIFGVKIPYIGKNIISYKNPDHGDIIVFRYPEDPDKDFRADHLSSHRFRIPVAYGETIFFNLLKLQLCHS